MQKMSFNSSRLLVLLVAGLLLSAPAIAEKPSQGEHGQSKKHGQDEGSGYYQDSRDIHARDSDHFGDHQRVVVREYYGERFRSGHCPPGLKKKHNGCMPPGQAKKWEIGQRLPRDVIFYDLPPRLIVELGAPPPGKRYVRVAEDVLLITIGAGIVLDAIEDLNNM